MNDYNHKEIEGKWQKRWDELGLNNSDDNSDKQKYYILVEFPYPSGDGLHTGHVRSYTALDVVARKRRAEGFNVLYPIGWDAFGLPTENYAIKTGIHPQEVTRLNTDNFRKQLKSLGFSFDWSREINTTDPNYYKWTQWIFLQFFKQGLAYKARVPINWCPKDKIGLANEEVVDGTCERCGTPVEQKEKEQWMLAITKYADRLNKDLDSVNFLPEIKAQQRNWIPGLRDWVFSRQRYWGEPIPLVKCGKCGWVPVRDENLPVELPIIEDFKPTEDGDSPLAKAWDWIQTTCPNCGGEAMRETDVMPNWAGSSWYYLRYIDPKNNNEFASKEKLNYWTPVDWYNGGMEHTTLHLLYSRFWHKFLFDQKLVPTNEPYSKRTSHGMVLAEGGVKMSKSKGNVVNPNDIVERLGADTLRLYELFMGPFNQAIAWSEDGLVGPRRFIERVWKLHNFIVEGSKIRSLANKTIKKVSEDIESMSFNTAVSTLMIFTNDLEKTPPTIVEYKILLRLLAPMAPHFTEELWSLLGENMSIHTEAWPKFSEQQISDEMVTIAIQINGKVRGTLELNSDISGEEVIRLAMASPEISRHIPDKPINRTIYVPGRILNLVF